eukprot:3650660-Rhodomonas_salina.1
MGAGHHASPSVLHLVLAPCRTRQSPAENGRGDRHVTSSHWQETAGLRGEERRYGALKVKGGKRRRSSDEQDIPGAKDSVGGGCPHELRHKAIRGMDDRSGGGESVEG